MMEKSGFGSRLFAWFFKRIDPLNEKIYGGYKKDLFHNIIGRVVEIGPGTGINFLYLPSQIDWTGLEPNPSFHNILLQRAEESGIHATIIQDGADHSGMPDHSADIVISTLVLCSVPDPEKAVSEIFRILKKGGRFIFMEHVAAPQGTSLRKIQNLCNPINRILADGCNCNRETWKLIESAGFSKVELRHVQIKESMSLHRPHIYGEAIK